MVYNKENIASFSIHKDNGKVFHCDKHCLPSESKQPETVKPFGPTYIFEGGRVVDPPPPPMTFNIPCPFGSNLA